MPLGMYVDISNNSVPVKWLGDYHGWTLHKAMGGTWDNFDEHSKNILEFKNGKSWAIDAFKTAISPMLTSQFGISFVPGHDPAKPPGFTENADWLTLCRTEARRPIWSFSQTYEDIEISDRR
jgi:hypothetical protein